MAEFKAFVSGETEQRFRQFWARLFKQSGTPGIVQKGVLGTSADLRVAQTTTASGSVTVSSGLALAQDTVGNGVSPLLNDTSKTLDVLGANPMGATPRNDMVVFDAATSSVRVIVGTPNAVPTDPAVPSTAVALARLRHAASATTVPSSKIDDLREYAELLGSGTAFMSYSPAWTADTTNPNPGNGSVMGEYRVDSGGMVDATIVVKMGTSGQAQGSGNYALSLPVPANLTEPFAILGTCAYTASGTNYTLIPNLLSANAIRVLVNNSNQPWNQTNPAAITTGAVMRVQVRYRRA